MWGRKDGRGGERCMKNNDWLRYNTTRDSTLGIKGKYRLKPDYIDSSLDSDSTDSDSDSGSPFNSRFRTDSEATIDGEPDEETEDEETEDENDSFRSSRYNPDEDYSFGYRYNPPRYNPPGLYLDSKREMERQKRQRNANNAVNRIKEGYVGKPDGYTEPPKSYNY